MNRRGFLYTAELLIGMLAITGLLVASTQTNEDNPAQLPGMLCTDILSVWTYGKNVETITSQLLPSGKYAFSSHTFPHFSKNGVVCHATRITNGIREEMYLRIES